MRPPVSCIALLAACWFALPAPVQAAPPQTQPDAAGKVAATVNGEPILESEILAALPEDAFDANLAEAKQTKLERMIETAVQMQFVREHKVEVSEAKLKEATTEFERYITTASCACCGGFANLQAYLEARWFTAAEFERKMRADVGMDLYLDRLLSEAVTPKLVADRRAEVEKGFVKGEILLFPYRYDPDFMTKPDAVKARYEALAKQAFGRLQKGDKFDAVLEDVGNNAMSYPGHTCISVEMLGDEARAAWPKLAVGKYCEPLKTSVGIYIIKPLALTDDDVRDVLRKQHEDSIRERVAKEFKAAMAQAKIVYPGKSTPAAGGSTSQPDRAAASR